MVIIRQKNLFLAFALIFICIFLLAACGSEGSEPDNSLPKIEEEIPQSEDLTKFSPIESGFCGDKLIWTIYSDTEPESGQEGSVTKLVIEGTGDMYNFLTQPGYDKEVVPWLDYKITDVTINEGVTSIGDWAFVDQSNIKSITMPNGVKAIGNSAFAECINLKDVSVPDSVINIRTHAFANCDSLKEITIPKNVKHIGNQAFGSCDDLETVVFSGDTIKFATGVFQDCINLKNITLPSKIEEVGDSTFSSCIKLENITIPATVTSIGTAAFFECDSLTEVTIPAGVKLIGPTAFKGCDLLTDIFFKGEKPEIDTWGCEEAPAKFSDVFEPQVVLHHKAGAKGWAGQIDGLKTADY